MNYYREGPHRPGGTQIRFGVPTMTPAVKMIMMICGGVWLVQLLSSRTDLLMFTLPGATMPLPFWWLLGIIPEYVFRGFLWQPLTYMFLHDPNSAFHILFNMLMVWMFGSELERHWGSRGFLRYYLVCGIGAGVIAALLGFFSGPGPESYRWGVTPPTIGASGAIFGIFMAYGMVFAERTILFMMLFPMKARTFAMIMAALALFNLLGQGNDGISHIAHVGGAITGFLYLKRTWRIGEFYRNLRWRMLRRKFKVMPPRDDDDSWIH